MNITNIVNEVILKAYEEAKTNNCEYVTVEHLLYVSLYYYKVIDSLKECGANIEELKNNLKIYIDEYITKVDDFEPLESVGFQQVIIIANAQVESCGKHVIDIEHLLAAIYNLEDSYAKYYLLEQGVTKRDLVYNLGNSIEEEYEVVDEEYDDYDMEEEIKNESGNESSIDKYALKLTEIARNEKGDPLIGREDILNRTIQILCRRNKNNPIHIGEPGVGKTSVTLGLAKMISEGTVPDKLKGAEIFSLDIGSMLSGTKYRGDFEERIKKVLDNIKKHKNPIVYIDEIHNIVGAGALSGSSLDASNLLKPYLLDGKIRFIGASTFDEYKKYFEKDKALNRRFQKIEIKEPSVSETLEIINGLKKNYESFHNVKYTDDAIKSAVVLSDKYINDKFLPDKAIDIIDEAGAYTRISSCNEEEIIIDEGIIENIISKVCNIPKQTVESNEINSLKNLEKVLKSNIFGQDEAIEEVTRCIKMSRAGLNEDNKPVAAMLFVGPTGVGKTEVAKNISKTLGIDLVRFDMSEYTEKHSASKLIGAPPGYVGYEEGGLLTDSIRKNPHCVLLLDEIEKAHIDILNVLLQVMDNATLTDNQGRKSDFKNIIIIMTSNAGAKNIGKNFAGFGDRCMNSQAIDDEVKKIFSPEFRNRLNKIVKFNHVDDDMAVNIAKKELEKFKQNLNKKNILIDFESSCVEYISKKGLSKEFGAREIIRLIDSRLKPLFVDEILFGNLSEGGRCVVDVINEEFKLDIL
ncbi:ATP-dependent Clp protease ATP-binding subunit ClpA [Tepidibacter hydrothermalis]|uniref:ATP-dependent Clp protease ATP-binding subunit ClpA n=1 Tax=Tepidibacter hydrothermalis TaxID=3036126 RepID=A0ABY8E7I8_9FIRM|nr:ATP-dependent Clp protease ATP-binding subunit ClpA [Tepidibacter hydrothermalis]WFD08853.1 ATP-dependent Clp protease ATP-binding subunit ClpA [Tepidibacter hydrothermalis]